MVSESSTGGERDDRMQGLQGELHIIRNEPKGMMDSMTELMATMMRSQGEEQQQK